MIFRWRVFTLFIWFYDLFWWERKPFSFQQSVFSLSLMTASSQEPFKYLLYTVVLILLSPVTIFLFFKKFFHSVSCPKDIVQNYEVIWCVQLQIDYEFATSTISRPHEECYRVQRTFNRIYLLPRLTSALMINAIWRKYVR